MFTLSPREVICNKMISLEGEDILYTHKVSTRTKTMKLAIYPDGRFVVTTPHRVNDTTVRDFIIKKSHWILEKIDYFKKNIKQVCSTHTQHEVKEYKKQAGAILQSRLPYFASYYKVTYKNITIKNINSRWGSCSSKGNLNFNYKIALLPPLLADYIIVHELCHLKEMNHGEKFWSLVAETIPNHKELRKSLRGVSL